MNKGKSNKKGLAKRIERILFSIIPDFHELEKGRPTKILVKKKTDYFNGDFTYPPKMKEKTFHGLLYEKSS